MIEQHAVVIAGLEDRLRFERLIADCAARLTTVTLPPDLDRQIEGALHEIVRFFHADRAALLGSAPRERLSWITCAASESGTAPDGSFGSMNFASAFPWHFAQLCAGAEPIAVSRLADLPAEAEQDRQSARVMGVRSMLTVPVRGHDGDAHVLLIQCLRNECSWPELYISRLALLARVFVNAFSRQRLEDTRQVESRHTDVLESAGAILWRADARTFEMRPIDAGGLVIAVVGLARPLAQSRQIELDTDLEPGLHSRGDAVQIQQVLLNLLFNAMDAVGDQRPEARHVTVRGVHRGSHVELAVSDSGRGIPEDALPRVFDPFFTTRADGMGMGLAICRSIVETHGGAIEVAGNPGGGTTVRFTLPAGGAPDGDLI